MTARYSKHLVVTATCVVTVLVVIASCAPYQPKRLISHELPEPCRVRVAAPAPKTFSSVIEVCERYQFTMIQVDTTRLRFATSDESYQPPWFTESTYRVEFNGWVHSLSDTTSELEIYGQVHYSPFGFVDGLIWEEQSMHAISPGYLFMLQLSEQIRQLALGVPLEEQDMNSFKERAKQEAENIMSTGFRGK